MQIRIETAKEVLESEKVFLNGEHRFNIVRTGKYSPEMTFIVSDDWIPYNKQGTRFYNPIYCSNATYQPETVKKYLAGMNFEFDLEDYRISFGNFRISQAGKPVFEILEPTRSSSCFISGCWGGAFAKHYGDKYVENAGIEWHKLKSSNGGGMGSEYYVVPIGWVYDHESRNPSELLEEFEQQYNQFKKNKEQECADYIKLEADKAAFKNQFIEKANEIAKELEQYGFSTTVVETKDGKIELQIPSETTFNDGAKVAKFCGGEVCFDPLPENIEKMIAYKDKAISMLPLLEEAKKQVKESLPKNLIDSIKGEWKLIPLFDFIWFGYSSVFTKEEDTPWGINKHGYTFIGNISQIESAIIKCIEYFTKVAEYKIKLEEERISKVKELAEKAEKLATLISE